MKTKTLIATTMLLVLASGLISAVAQGTAFTYQGLLTSAGVPFTGNAEFQPTLWDAPSGGTKIADNSPPQVLVAVSNGLFVLPLDFGASFPGADRWLQLEVRTAIGPFTVLSPRQKLTATPYAISAGNLTGMLPASQLTGTIPSAKVSGTYSGAVTFNNPANSFSGNGTGLTSLNASQLTSGTVPAAALGNAWKIGGNAGTTPGTHFVGTTDNQPLEIKVNGQRALRLEPNGTNAPNVIGGWAGNYVPNTVVGATIGGGGAGNWGGITFTNRVLGDFGTVGGGRNNTASGIGSTVGGGDLNTASGQVATVGGGLWNAASTNYATVGGGDLNTASGIGSTVGGGERNTASGYNSTVSGGRNNTASGFTATVSGGLDNTASGEAATVGGGLWNAASTNYATVGGGRNNTASGCAATIPGGDFNTATNYAFAAGRRALARHTGALVWGDSTDADIASTNANSVTMRASGGYRLFSNAGATAGVYLAPGGGSWTSLCDRNAKEDFQPVNPLEVLAKVAALPVTTWKYKSQDGSVRHIGPTAQDFHATFGVGESDIGITGIDADGVALAAIQGLNEKLTEELKRRDAENAELRRQLTELKELVRQLLK